MYFIAILLIFKKIEENLCKRSNNSNTRNSTLLIKYFFSWIQKIETIPHRGTKSFVFLSFQTRNKTRRITWFAKAGLIFRLGAVTFKAASPCGQRVQLLSGKWVKGSAA